MNLEQVAVWATVVLIASVAVVSGPLVGSVDIVTDERGDALFCNGGGTGDVTVESVPTESFTLEKQGFGTDTYSLTDEPVVITVGDVTGCLVLTHEVEIPALGFSSLRLNYVNDDSHRRQQLSTTGGTFDARRITRESYKGTLTVELRGETNRTLHESNVTISVVE